MCDSTLLSLSGSMIKIRVGAEDSSSARIYSVHQDLLTQRSEFFKRATTGSWREVEEKLTTFLDDDLNTFNWLLLCRLYVLAEKLQDTAAKDATIDSMLIHASTKAMVAQAHPISDAIRELYEGTPGSSAARRLVVDFAVFPKEFLYDFAIRMLKAKGSGIARLSAKYRDGDTNIPYEQRDKKKANKPS
ncbi:hypothetical protein CC86DRAFT_466009 [Ophiobolus disseminans]|uniref:BTB domain-containing protein n=1 Tax=Ophiobolus disseminans TaxID=1469910 RepID=A0A6A7A1I3_9PLEO|nr:hypothetical protein CC86DRAFT_466009 [Ophiobolus disseminans]